MVACFSSGGHVNHQFEWGRVPIAAAMLGRNGLHWSATIGCTATGILAGDQATTNRSVESSRKHLSNPVGGLGNFAATDLLEKRYNKRQIHFGELG